MTEYYKALTRRRKAMQYSDRERKRQNALIRYNLWAVYRLL